MRYDLIEDKQAVTSPACVQQGARGAASPALFGSAARGCETPPNEEERSASSSSRPAPRQQTPSHDRAIQQAAGLVQGALLEGGDGADAGRPAVLGEDHLRQRDRGNQAFPAFALLQASLE